MGTKAEWERKVQAQKDKGRRKKEKRRLRQRDPAQAKTYQGRLNWFWRLAEYSIRPIDRLELLRQFARVKCGRPTKYRQRRRIPARVYIHVFGEPCFVCRRLADVAHHIIQLQHNGRNSPKNLVPLCNGCHADVHPWLEPTELPSGHQPLWSEKK